MQKKISISQIKDAAQEAFDLYKTLIPQHYYKIFF